MEQAHAGMNNVRYSQEIFDTPKSILTFLNQISRIVVPSFHVKL